MGRRAKGETIVVSDGIYLKDVDGVFHCYFRLSGKQFRRNTNTSDLATAKLKSLQWHRDALRKADAGETVEVISFARLKRSYLEHICRQSKYEHHLGTIDRHFLPFFVKFDDISRIKTTSPESRRQTFWTI